MRIIVDISINHTGTNHPWFRKALENPHAKEHSYYCFGEDGKPVCWAGVPTLVQLNYGCGELRDALYRKPESVMILSLTEVEKIRRSVLHHVGRLDEQRGSVDQCIKPVFSLSSCPFQGAVCDKNNAITSHYRGIMI